MNEFQNKSPKDKFRQLTAIRYEIELLRNRNRKLLLNLNQMDSWLYDTVQLIETTESHSQIITPTISNHNG